MRTWVRGAIAAFFILSGATGTETAFAQVHGGNGPPPRPTPKPPPPRPSRPHRPVFHQARLALYSLPHYRGQHVTLTRSTSDFHFIGFNDRAMSLRVNGHWRLCEHSHYGGRCITVRRDQSTIFGLTGQASSARLEGR
jgi:hypothetical protein